MGNLSENFDSSEFLCKCGRCSHSSNIKVHPDLVFKLQQMRDQEGVPLRITSGARCLYHNQKIPGSVGASSWHVPRSGVLHACDITFQDDSMRGCRDIIRLYVRASQQRFSGLGLYHGRIHVDVRPGNLGRWTDASWSWSNFGSG